MNYTIPVAMDAIPAPVGVALMVVGQVNSIKVRDGEDFQLSHHEQEAHESALSLLSEYMRSSPIMARARKADQKI